MTKHNIDDLFKQKLDGGEFSPSPAAWSTLENKLQEKKRRGIIFWVSIAASIVLLVTFGWIMLSSEQQIAKQAQIAQTNKDNTPIYEAETNPVAEEKNSQDALNNDQNTEAIDNETAEPQQIEEKPSEQPVKKQVPTAIVPQQNNLAQATSAEKTLPVDKTQNENEQVESSNEKDNDVAPELLIDDTELLADNSTTSERGSVKLVYTLKPVISSNSSEQTEVQESSVDNEPATKKAFGKVLAFAKNLKDNPGSMSELRGAKNSFLSLGTKKKNDSK